jgi:predicted phosphohydrolase
MKIQYASDLHLEFPENKAFLNKNPLLPGADILLLAGDIVPFKVLEKHNDFFDYLSDNFKTTYWVPGNHEYYYFDLAKKQGSFNEKIRENVFLLNNIAIQVQDITFIFSTLWSHISDANQWQIQQRLSDFHVIGYNKGMLLPAHYNQSHQDSLTFINKELAQTSDKRKIVVTHHVPTFLNYPEEYQGDPMNDAFATELYDLILESKIDYWIYGHHHRNIFDFKIGGTSFITNQLGYVKYNENQGFENKCINI